MGLAKLDYSCSAPQGLPDTFPLKLGAVKPDIADLDLIYDSKKSELRIRITLANGIAAENDASRQQYDEIVIALVDNIAFDLGYPLDPPRVNSYRGPSGSVTIFAAPAIIHMSGSATLLPDLAKLKKRLSDLPPSCTLLQEYNAAIHISNPVQQFTAFWGLLTFIARSDSVNAVEKCTCARGTSISRPPRR